MKSDIILSLSNNFEDHSKTTENGIEFWFARDLQQLLGYTKWDNFKKVIHKAKISTEHITNNQGVQDILLKRGIKPEELPAEEDIKKLERRVNIEPKKIGRNPDKLK